MDLPAIALAYLISQPPAIRKSSYNGMDCFAADERRESPAPAEGVHL